MFQYKVKALRRRYRTGFRVTGLFLFFFHRKTFVWLIVLEIQHANKCLEGILPT